jgi:CDGSH-type Zn-finger protein
VVADNAIDAALHGIDEQASSQCGCGNSPGKILCDGKRFSTSGLPRDSAGPQTGQTRIASCDRLLSTTIYAIWGLPINELYTSGLAAH